MTILGLAQQQSHVPGVGKSWTQGEGRELLDDDQSRHFLALQPVFDRQREVVGYEALSRSGGDNRFTGDSKTATQIVVNDWLIHGLDHLTGGLPIFLNCTREFLVEGALTLPPNSVILELLETVEPDDEVLAACRGLIALGYQIALDDFQPSPKMVDLLTLADYVKVDFRLSNKRERREILRHLQGRDTKLLAEKIETAEEFDLAFNEGFDLFQGYYLARPTVFSKGIKRRCRSNFIDM